MKKIIVFVSSLLIAVGLFVVPTVNRVSSVASIEIPSIHINTVQSYPSIHAEVNGNTYPAIVYQGSTYLLWGALKLFDTPYKYEGGGLFYIAGYDVQGVVYQGNTYLPWYAVNGNNGVNATHLSSGGWNFTHKWSDTSDGYKLDILLAHSTANVGVEDPMWIRTYKADGTPINGTGISITESSNIPGYGSGVITDATASGDTLYWPQMLADPGIDYATVTWTDPNGVLHTQKAQVTFQSAKSTETPIPSDDKVVAQVPAQFSNAQVFFDSKVNGQSIHWQLDTGAQSPVINGTDAAKLNLPHEGTIQIQGVTGSGTAYTSHMDVTIGGVTFKHVFCIVYPAMQGTSLFGFTFFAGIDPTTGAQGQQFDILLSQKHNTLTILK